MDLKEFALQLSKATESMTPEQRAQIKDMFAKVSDQLNAYDKNHTDKVEIEYEGTEVPNGPTPRLKALS